MKVIDGAFTLGTTSVTWTACTHEMIGQCKQSRDWEPAPAKPNKGESACFFSGRGLAIGLVYRWAALRKRYRDDMWRISGGFTSC